MTTHVSEHAESVGLSEAEAARLTGLSGKTLKRRADAGEPVGRITIGTRVLYHRPTLLGWLANKAGASPSTT